MSGVSSVVNKSANQNVYFKGKKEERKARKAESDAVKYSKPLKTHTATFWGVLGAATSAIATPIARKIITGDPKLRALVTGLGIALGSVYLLGGLLIDRKINKNRAEFEAKRKEIGDDKLLAEQDKHVQFTKNGNVYYKTSVGKKGGLILGALLSIFPTFKLGGLYGKKVGGSSLIGGALGGTILGAIIDGGANKRARKFADKKAEFEANMRAQAEAQADAEDQPVMSENV